VFLGLCGLFRLNNLQVQGSEQVFSSFKHDFEGFGAELTRHVTVPDAYDDHDVFNTHFLEKMQKLLPRAFLSAVIKTLYQLPILICVLLGIITEKTPM
jgi:hypothetical protein